MRATAKFSDPSDAAVTITLSGTLFEFEAFGLAIREAKIPFYKVQALLEQIDQAAHKLRSAVTVEAGEAGENQ